MYTGVSRRTCFEHTGTDTVQKEQDGQHLSIVSPFCCFRFCCICVRFPPSNRLIVFKNRVFTAFALWTT